MQVHKNIESGAKNPEIAYKNTLQDGFQGFSFQEFWPDSELNKSLVSYC